MYSLLKYWIDKEGLLKLFPNRTLEEYELLYNLIEEYAIIKWGVNMEEDIKVLEELIKGFDNLIS